MKKSITNINGVDITRRIEVNSKAEAWSIIDRIFPTDYSVDEVSSAAAGYKVYRSTAEGHWYDYICDLNDRYEVNLSNGITVNVWFSEIYMKAKELAHMVERLTQENDDLTGEVAVQKHIVGILEAEKKALSDRVTELEQALSRIQNTISSVM